VRFDPLTWPKRTGKDNEGAADGRIGKSRAALVPRLLDRGDTPVILDVRAPRSLNEGAVFIEASVLDRSKLREIFRGCDGIVHIAAWHGIHEDRGEKDAYDFFDLNVESSPAFRAAVAGDPYARAIGKPVAFCSQPSAGSGPAGLNHLHASISTATQNANSSAGLAFARSSLHFSQRLADCGAMARCAVSESCAVVDTKGEYRRAHRDSVERVTAVRLTKGRLPLTA
jgi:nucleoside-diphosphate-sugar epimerase